MGRKINNAESQRAEAKELIMTNLIKRKGLLYLILIVALVSVMAIACKKSPTQPLDTSLADESTEYQNPEEVDLKESEYKTIYELSEGDIRNYTDRTFHYKIELKEVNGKMTLLWKKGDYKAGGTQSYGGNDYGILRNVTRDSSKDIVAEGKKAFGDINSEEVFYIKISADGNSLEFYPHGMQIPFKLAKIK